MITGLHLAELRTYIGLEVAALTCYRAEKNAHLHFCETLSFSKGDLLPVLSLVMEHVVTVREGASLNILFQSNIKKSVHWISSKSKPVPRAWHGFPLWEGIQKQELHPSPSPPPGPPPYHPCSQYKFQFKIQFTWSWGSCQFHGAIWSQEHWGVQRWICFKMIIKAIINLSQYGQN